MVSTGRPHLRVRHSLQARIGLTFGALIFALALLLSVGVGAVVRERLQEDGGQFETELAFQMADKLDRGMFNRYHNIQILADLTSFRADSLPNSPQRLLLEELQATYPEYAWIGLTDSRGRVLVSTDNLLLGEDVSSRPWFQQVAETRAPFVGDVHEALLLASLLPNPTGEPLRFVDLAAPMLDEQGAVQGVLGAHLSWQWAQEVEASLLRPLQSREGVEVLVLRANGEVMLGPPGWVGQTLALQSVEAATREGTGYRIERWPDGTEYLTGFARSEGYRDYPSLGWVVLVRQPSAVAFAPATRLQRQLLGGAGLAGALAAALGWLLAGRIVAPLRAIAAASERIRAGDLSATIPTPRGQDEVTVLADSLGRLLSTLTAQQEEMRQLNESLEQRVLARTQELDEANHQLRQQLAVLEQRGREIALLHQLDDLLQACRNEEEAHEVIAAIGAQMFPHMRGVLARLNPSQNRCEMVASWGAISPNWLSFQPEQCWALRRGRFHRADGRLACPHAVGSEGGMCLPLAAQGRALGVLTLLSSGDGQPFVADSTQEQLAQAVADSVGLSLANLELRETLRQQSIRDGLTGLFNRRYLEETLEREVNRALRADQPLSVLMLDIDHFKRFNDSHGHEAGDLLLRAVAQFLMNELRAGDVACRYGGEELTLVLPNAPLEAAALRAEQLRLGIERLDVMHRGVAVGPVTVSLGVAALPVHGQSAELLLRRADEALYAAKHAGRNRVVVAELPPTPAHLAEGERS